MHLCGGRMECSLHNNPMMAHPHVNRVSLAFGGEPKTCKLWRWKGGPMHPRSCCVTIRVT